MREKNITLEEVQLGRELFYKISDVDAMAPFFMTIVSDSDHWLFIASNGGLSAGRRNAEFALFPYYTDDKITEMAETTGSKTILRVHGNGRVHLWEPFSIRSEDKFQLQRNLYKSRYGNKIVFEEINHDLQLGFQYTWCSSHRFGFVRYAQLTNLSDNVTTVEILDGIQNVLPYGIGSDLQNFSSNLADAYKRSELLSDTGLAIFTLSAIIVDRAEPSESLKANVAWSAGLPSPVYLLSATQLQKFRRGEPLQQEADVKGMKGAYYLQSTVALPPQQKQEWYIVANVHQSQPAVIALAENIRRNPRLIEEVLDDVETGTARLEQLVSAADGLQYTADSLADTRHFANVLFNIMRGGIFDNHYQIITSDFKKYLFNASRAVYQRHQKMLDALPENITYFTLREIAAQSHDRDFRRLAIEYLPLKFSRRHGDPSRPWNKFSINTQADDGSKVLDYQGNWRDIFQNWEALVQAYPAFIEGMIYKFLNASTFDGYNPYRVTKGGFDWETIEPDNPWSYIGYWGDHQIIYLLKFLEFAHNALPDVLASLREAEDFVYANVPYQIKSYREICSNPKDTIRFNHTLDKTIRERMEQLGADAALLLNRQHQIHHVSFIEKVLATLLAKLTNLVPDGGIWMNTQRPEWNDANNALVGNGISMVTLYYLRRFIVFIRPWFEKNHQSFRLSEELGNFCLRVATVYENFAPCLVQGLNGEQRKQMLDQLGMAADAYRNAVYALHFSGNSTKVKAKNIAGLLDHALQFIDTAIRNNRRPDGLYHSYNLLTYNDHTLEISHLSEMLEGQVAVLSSGYLSPEESVSLLDALRQSALYRADQNSYILYPDKQLPSFLQKNNVPASDVQAIPLLQDLLRAGNTDIIEQDVLGGFHFNGSFRNADDLDKALNRLDERYQKRCKEDAPAIKALFEKVFQHKAFTGRSGTFFAYEGLGSIYWHMVSKLLLAVQEVHALAMATNTDAAVVAALAKHFHAIKEGIGVHKSPKVYGAFPTDPYSHTPAHKGAQQPGMTGQVKEDILTRMGELGVMLKGAQYHFTPSLLQHTAFCKQPTMARFIQLEGSVHTIPLEKDTLAFSVCQVPVIYHKSAEAKVEVEYNNGSREVFTGNKINTSASLEIMQRTGKVRLLHVYVEEKNLL